jgi:hypothetical protein
VPQGTLCSDDYCSAAADGQQMPQYPAFAWRETLPHFKLMQRRGATHEPSVQKLAEYFLPEHH